MRCEVVHLHAAVSGFAGVMLHVTWVVDLFGAGAVVGAAEVDALGGFWGAGWLFYQWKWLFELWGLFLWSLEDFANCGGLKLFAEKIVCAFKFCQLLGILTDIGSLNRLLQLRDRLLWQAFIFNGLGVFGPRKVESWSRLNAMLRWGHSRQMQVKKLLFWLFSLQASLLFFDLRRIIVYFQRNSWILVLLEIIPIVRNCLVREASVSSQCQTWYWRSSEGKTVSFFPQLCTTWVWSHFGGALSRKTTAKIDGWLVVADKSLAGFFPFLEERLSCWKFRCHDVSKVILGVF